MPMNNIYCPTFYRCLYEWVHATEETYSSIDFELKLTYATPSATYTIVTNDDVMMWLRNHIHWKFIAHFGDDDVVPPPTEYASCIGLLMTDMLEYYRRHMYSICAFFDEIHAGHNPLETGWANSKTTRTFEGLGFSDEKESYSTGNAYNGLQRELSFTAPTTSSSASFTVGDKLTDNELINTSKTSSASSGDTRQGKAYGAIGFSEQTGLPVANEDNQATNPKTTVAEGTFQSTTSSTEQPLATETISTGDVATRNATGATTESKQVGGSNSDNYNYEHIKHAQEGSDITETESNRGEADMIERFLEFYRVDFVNLLLDGFLKEYCFMADEECDD